MDTLQKARPTWRALAIAFAIPLVAYGGIFGLYAAFASRNPLLLGLPLTGPWTGCLIGHWDCTLANARPMESWLLAAGVPGLILTYRWTPARARYVLLALAFTWSCAWAFSSLLSLANAAS